MAVYKRNYRRYDGALTGRRWRFAILPRYAIKTVFESRLFTAFFTLCFIPHLIAAAIIYIRSNVAALETLNLQPLQFLAVDGDFFQTLFYVESFMSFFMASLVGPGLVAPDLANNALPMYLSRPFSRKEYILGKLTVLLAMTSVVTWIPGLLVLGLQVNVAGMSWLRENAHLAVGIVVGSWIWILTISLVTLAISAWVRFKPIATVSLFGVFFACAAFGEAANEILVLRPRWGELMNLAQTMGMIWTWLLQDAASYERFLRDFAGQQILPVGAAFAALSVFCALALLLLVKKVRASEVVRG